MANFIPPENGASRGNYFLPEIYFASPEIIEVKRCHRQTDRKILRHHLQGYADFFFQLYLLPPYFFFLQGDNIKILDEQADLILDF